MKKYSTLIFDLFDTIVNFNFGQLPLVERNGVRSRTTSKEVYEVFKKHFPEVSFEDFYAQFTQSYHTFLDIKKKEYREFPNRDRFTIMLDKMGIEPDDETDQLKDSLVKAHMNGLSGCVEFPEENKETLKLARSKGYRLGIVSNFDHAPTARMLIEKFSIGGFFQSIVISEDVGWRKPKDIIFKKSLSELKEEPDDCLFIGDNFDADIAGAKNVGMDGVWINRHSETTQGLNPEPAYIISKLSELKALI